VAFGDWVQGTSVDAGSVSTSSLTFGSSTVTGNSIVVAIRRGGAHGTITVTDNKSNTYVEDATGTFPTGSDPTLAVFRTSNITGGASHQVTVTYDSAGTMRWAVEEYAGNFALHGTPPVATGTSSAPSSGNQTTTATCAIVGAVALNQNATYTAGTGFTLRHVAPAGPNTKIGTEDKNGAQAAGTHAATMSTSGGAVDWIAALCAYSDAAGAADPFPAGYRLGRFQPPNRQTLFAR
jgi:hypothetical protein